MHRIQSNLTRCLALFVLCASGAQATEPAWAQEPAPTNHSDPSNGQFLRRILHLKNGAIVRTACSLRDGRWYLGRSDTSQSIPSFAVTSFELEKDVLAAWKDQTKLAAPGTLPAWCLDHGLLKEGVAQLDRDLGSLALRPLALQALVDYQSILPAPPEAGEGATPGDIFDAHARWLSKQNTASLHELAAQSLAQIAREQTPSTAEGEAAPWETCLRKELAGRQTARRELALTTLAHWQKASSGMILRRFAMLDSNEGARAHAAWLLGTLNDAEQVSGLIAWLDHDHSEVRVRAANALGFAGYPAAIPALVAGLGSGSARQVPHAHIFVGSQTAYVQDFDVEVANRSSVADPVINVLPTGVVLDAGVVSVSIERTIYHRALSRITGHRPGTSESAWSKWL
ncbi:MAG: HEAT repeat domain-containing protein, partial [Planctomycetes bacterium]|nr:HEAT repeat domain-containing protein [Planctomycetota bacterium]